MSSLHAYTLRRTAAVVVSSLLLVGAVEGAASAHVTVHVDDPRQGAADVAVTFRVPSERDDAGTTKLDVFFPQGTPLLDVYVQPHPGWTARSTTQHLAQPVTTDDGPISEAVSEITWTANAQADALAPGQSADFVMTVGQLPDARSLTFKVLQTYSNHEVVRWIDLPSTDEPDPENPAPSVNLAPLHPASSATDNEARVLGAAGLAGVLGLAIAAGLTRRKRTAEPAAWRVDRPTEHAQ